MAIRRQNLNIQVIKQKNKNFNGFIVDDSNKPPQKVVVKELEHTTKIDKLSILIPAYGVENFIEECLDSVENQIYFQNNNNYEVIVGVDGCEKTLKKLLQIRNKYRNLVILNMKTNMGLNVTINTLLSQCNGDYVFKLDSDDYLDVSAFDVLKKYGNYDIIRFKSKDFIGSPDNFHVKGPHDGVFIAKRRVYDELGGYKPWRCAADTDFRYRLSAFKFKKINVDTPIYFRRIHQNSLTNKLDTNYGSKLRSEYKKQLGKGDKKIIPVINDFTVI